MTDHDERTTICTDCIRLDPMHCTDDGWRGDCPWWKRINRHPGHDPEGSCSYGCHEEPECQTCCPGIEPDGWGPDPGGAPCHTCGGIGAVTWMVDTHPRYQGRLVYL